MIDLDTVMPGTSLYDFGDMVRSMTNSGEEDSQDTSQIEMRIPVFEALDSAAAAAGALRAGGRSNGVGATPGFGARASARFTGRVGAGVGTCQPRGVLGT